MTCQLKLELKLLCTRNEQIPTCSAKINQLNCKFKSKPLKQNSGFGDFHHSCPAPPGEAGLFLHTRMSYIEKKQTPTTPRKGFFNAMFYKQ